MNITRNNSKQMLKRAGRDIANANNNVLMPLVPFTSLRLVKTLSAFIIRTTRSNVGDTKYCAIKSLSNTPVMTLLVQIN